MNQIITGYTADLTAFANNAFGIHPNVAAQIEAVIAREMNKPHTAVEDEAKKVRKRLSNAEIENRQMKVIALVAAGKDREEMASTLGVSYHTVRNDVTSLIKAGRIPRLANVGNLQKKRMAATKARRAEVARMHRAGKTTQEIATRFEISISTAWKDINILIKAGTIKAKPPRWTCNAKPEGAGL